MLLGGGTPGRPCVAGTAWLGKDFPFKKCQRAAVGCDGCGQCKQLGGEARGGLPGGSWNTLQKGSAPAGWERRRLRARLQRVRHPSCRVPTRGREEPSLSAGWGWSVGARPLSPLGAADAAGAQVDGRLQPGSWSKPPAAPSWLRDVVALALGAALRRRQDRRRSVGGPSRSGPCPEVEVEDFWLALLRSQPPSGLQESLAEGPLGSFVRFCLLGAAGLRWGRRDGTGAGVIPALLLIATHQPVLEGPRMGRAAGQCGWS